MVFLPRLIVVGIILTTALGAQAQQYTQIDIEAPFDKVVLQSELLMAGSLEIVRLSNGSEYLISVGVTKNKDLKGNNPRGRVTTIKLAKMKARKRVATFIEAKISTEVRLTKVRTKTTKLVDGKVERDTKVRKRLMSWTSEKAREVLRDARTIGTWYRKDLKYFYTAIVIPLGE